MRYPRLYWHGVIKLVKKQYTLVTVKTGQRRRSQTAFDHVKIDFKVSFDQIEVADDWGFVRGGYEGAIIPKPEGEPIPDKGKYLEILKRQPDGSWKFACHMYSSDNSLEPPEEN